MKKYAIIVAAGLGTRMGNPVPKQFLMLRGRPLLEHTVGVFAAAFPDITILVVTHPNYLDLARKIFSTYPEVQILAGAATRANSVRAGLEYVEDDSIVFVQDGVRCLTTRELIQRCYAAALEKGNAVPSVAAVDSVRIIKGDNNQWLDRNQIRLIQTPQTFRADIIKKAYAQIQDQDLADDAIVAERSGIIINLVDGETTNIKVTYPQDLALAEIILKQREINA